MRETLIRTLALALLLGTGALAWALELRPPPEVDTAALRALPYRIGDWRGRDVPLEDDVSRLLDATENVQRVYVGPAGSLVWLYVGYYGTERGGRPEHTPWVCYPTAGWEIASAETVTGRGEPPHRVNELVVEQAGERRLVHFYYRSHRSTGLLGGLDQGLDRLTSRILTGRADGALVRLSTPLLGDPFVARARLQELGARVDALFEAHWPHERQPRTAATSGANSSASTPSQ
ncbi:MAG: exosortase C-terminal domain/associated protein EpsI [Myxococcota bacterium]